MTTDYKQKNDIPNLYQILGLTADVCKEPNCDELVQKAYIKKAKICHPDKHPGRKDIEEIFELLTSAYDILKDEKQRNAYNHKLSLNKQSSNDFFKLKKSASDYMETIGEYKPPSDQQKLDFKEQMKTLDSKHGYDSSNINIISQDDAKKKLNDLTKIRKDQDRHIPERLFDEGRFDTKVFNAVFDRFHNRDEGAMVSHNGAPSAWNDLGVTANYGDFGTETNYSNLYVDEGTRFDTGKQMFGNVDFGTTMKKITKDDIKNIPGADYVDGHNVISDDYYKEMKAKIRDRDSDAKGFENMKYGDFKKDDTAGYGIFDQLGFKIDDKLTFDTNEEDISKKFDKLLAERQKELPGGNALTQNNHKKSTKGAR